jgi:hypothetical protein
MAFPKKSDALSALSRKYEQRLQTRSADQLLKKSAGEFNKTSVRSGVL